MAFEEKKETMKEENVEEIEINNVLRKEDFLKTQKEMVSEGKKEMKTEYNLEEALIQRSNGIEMKQIPKTREAIAS